MGNLINDRIVKPTPKNRVSVLFILALGIILAIIGVSSWSYFGQKASRPPAHVTASAEISGPVEILPDSEAAAEASEDSSASSSLPEVTPDETDKTQAATLDSATQFAPPVAKDAVEAVEVEKALKAAPEINVETPEPETPAAAALVLPTPEPQVMREEPANEIAEPLDAVTENTEITPETPNEPTPATPSLTEVATVQSAPPAPPETTPLSDSEVAAVPKAEEKADEEPEPLAAATPVPALGPAPSADEDAPETAEKTTAAPDTAVTEVMPPWKQFAAAFTAPENLPRIAIVISEAGMNSQKTREAINNLPAAITLSFNPYGRNLQTLADEARRAGHEVLLQIPMEPAGYPAIDPGPQALRTDLTDTENLTRLDWVLNRITGYAGLTNQMGSKFTATANSLRPALAAIREGGLLFLDSRTASNSVAAAIAAELEIPVAINNRFLDHKADGDAIDARLQELEVIAKKTGSAIGIAYPHEETFRHLADWAKTLEGKGLALAPVSAIVNRQEIR